VKGVERSEIIDYVTYEEGREPFRQGVMAAKEARRVHIGEHLTLLFENRETIRYQIQEMIRTERLVKESDIQHEIDTYNELLGGPGELGCTLLIELDDPELRRERLREWWSLPEKIYLVLEDGTQVPAKFDERQRGGERVSSVQYLKFDTHGVVPVAVSVDVPGLKVETQLTPAQREALRRDLAE
jgi:uncharacterized protein DUF3501